MLNKNSKILICQGHGDNDSGATSNGLKEVDINFPIGKEVGQELRVQGFNNVVVESELGRNGALSYEKSIAEKFDLVVSIHVNAFNGQAEGFEVFCNLNNKETRRISEEVLKTMTDYGFKPRGVKSGNHLAMVGGLDTNAILVETGFIDNAKDRSKIDEAHEQKEIGKRYAHAITRGMGYTVATPQPSIKPITEGYFRVIAGSYKERSNAEAQQKKLKDKGFDSFLVYEEVKSNVR